MPEQSSAILRLGVMTVGLAAICLSTIVLRPASAHEPITTRVRFNKEVIRVLQRSCLGCHHPGGVAMSLATYEEARPWAKAIKEELLEKRMPPWCAVKGYGEFSNAPSLTQRDVDMIVNWVEGGAPKGDEKDLPPAPLFSNDWQLGKPDLTLKPEAQSKIAADADEFRTLVIGTNLKEDRWISAIDLQPGNGTVVHCAKFYSLKSSADAPPMTPVKTDDRRIISGFECGDRARDMDAWSEASRRLRMVLLNCFKPARASPSRSTIAAPAKRVNDLSTVGLYFAKSLPRKPIQEIAITNSGANIPVAAEPYPIKVSVTTQSDTEAIAIRPRVHPLVMSLQATAYRPDGSEEVLIWTRRYQFDWEPTYVFRQPITLPKGTRVEVVAYFDNSGENQKNPNDPPKPLRWSEISGDPLCALLVVSSAAGAGPVTTR